MSDMKPKPALRIDGGQRINLKEKRARRKAKRAVEQPPIEDTRVTDAWKRDEAMTAARKRLSAEGRRVRRLTIVDGGKDGARIEAVKVKLSSERSGETAVRAKPGTFEWRYGRNRQDAVFHAGSHLAILWERAGATMASSADFLRGISSGYATGISDGRVAAIDLLHGFVVELGRIPSQRLIDYCVIGMTSTEIAIKHGVKERDMAPVLHQDLRACAMHFHFLGKRR